MDERSKYPIVSGEMERSPATNSDDVERFRNLLLLLGIVPHVRFHKGVSVDFPDRRVEMHFTLREIAILDELLRFHPERDWWE